MTNRVTKPTTQAATTTKTRASAKSISTKATKTVHKPLTLKTPQKSHKNHSIKTAHKPLMLKSLKHQKATGRIKTARYSKLRLKRDIMREGKILGLHTGSTEAIAERVADEVEKWLASRSAVTENDLDRVISTRLRKFNPDLAFMFRERKKFI